MKIAVVGLGRAGLPLAAVIADSGLSVIGVDIDRKRCEAINSGKNPIPEEIGLDKLVKKHGGKNLAAVSNYRDAEESDLFIIIVPLFTDENKNPDFSILESAFRNVGRILKRGDTVVLETTVPPSTTELLAKRWLEEESGLSLASEHFYLAYSPERIMTGLSISRLKEFPKVLGGVNKKSGEKAFKIYKKFIHNMQQVSSARVAEYIKLMEGCYRDVNIALANELFKIAGELDIDFYEAREHANHQYCEIHLPSTGVGGHCIPVYPWFLIKEMEKREQFDSARLLRTSRELNDEMIEYWAWKIIMGSRMVNKPLNEVKICLKGITFRKGVKELFHSRNLALAKLLEKKGLNVYVHDKSFSNEELKKIGLKSIAPEQADLTFDCFKLKLKHKK